ncbi:Lysine--tRNA ligase [Operophtera brumata]|uniref:Lysine--tRNA ligase n=1 Tax=Operophtera brumata TaxID=104452 RepID=A0A0L7LI26_OPEBR|nr:Lysine--tRNA ligase [Operophtera brumata]
MARLALVFDILDNAHGVDIRQRRNLRRMSRYTEKAFAMNDAEFKKCYRVGKELFEVIRGDLEPLIPRPTQEMWTARQLQ